MNQNQVHVGCGTTRGAMTIFPVWHERHAPGRWTMNAATLEVSELDGGPQVGTLMVGNTGDRPVLVLEGQLFEGGWQHRMARHSVLVGVHQRIAVEVACVEQGRWHGGTRQHTRGRRATPYLRDSVRTGRDVQGEVWRRVSRHTADVPNATESFVTRLDGADVERRAWAGVRPLPGQSGVLIGIGGQPYVLEVFDSPLQLRTQWREILAAAALDARLAPAVATPGRRARRFVERLARVESQPQAQAGIGERWHGATEHADLASLRWRDSDLHVRATNVRHPMLVVA